MRTINDLYKARFPDIDYHYIARYPDIYGQTTAERNKARCRAYWASVRRRRGPMKWRQ